MSIQADDETLRQVIADLDTPVTHRGTVTEVHYDEPIPPPPFVWTYDGSDPAVMLFTASVERFRMTFPKNSRILELGCAESDWLERMAATGQGFDLVGVNQATQSRSQTGFTLKHASALQADLFEPESFDRIVLLGALEHFGLGFYGDPVNDAGDTLTMQNVARWLKPGGFVYFDVPCQPYLKIAENRHFRSYAAAPEALGSVQERILKPSGLLEINRAYSLPEPNAGTWCQEPTEWLVPYWFVAILAQKRAK